MTEINQQLIFSSLKIALILIFSISFYCLIKAFTKIFLKNIAKSLPGKFKPKEGERKRFRLILHVINRTTVVVLFIIAFLMIISELGININPLLAGAGIAGVAISLGAQTLVRDVINGLFMAVEGHVSPGDLVKIDNVEGQVVDFNLRRVLIRDDQGVLYYIPNSEIKIVANKSRK